MILEVDTNGRHQSLAAVQGSDRILQCYKPRYGRILSFRLSHSTSLGNCRAQLRNKKRQLACSIVWAFNEISKGSSCRKIGALSGSPQRAAHATADIGPDPCGQHSLLCWETQWVLGLPMLFECSTFSHHKHYRTSRKMVRRAVEYGSWRKFKLFCMYGIRGDPKELENSHDRRQVHQTLAESQKTTQGVQIS